MPTPYVKVLGERNCGTNVLSRTISSNFDVVVAPSNSPLSRKQRAFLGRAEPSRARRDELREVIRDYNHLRDLPIAGGWKHAAATQALVDQFLIRKSAIAVCILRHPASWAQAMHRHPFHALTDVPADFSFFIRAPWLARPRDELSDPLLASPLELLKAKAKSYGWLCRAYPRTVILRYQDLVLDPSTALLPLQKHLSQTTPEVVLPKAGVRGFIEGEVARNDFVEKARSTGYDMLAASDAAFLQELLEGSFLASMYDDAVLGDL